MVRSHRAQKVWRSLTQGHGRRPLPLPISAVMVHPAPTARSATDGHLHPGAVERHHMRDRGAVAAKVRLVATGP